MIKRILIFLALFLTYNWVNAQDEDHRYVPETDTLVLQKIEAWQGLKFGLLMHWGTYSQWGIVESWSLCPEDEGWCRRKNPDYFSYVKEYENLQTTFNPGLFDPAKWAKAAKEAGMKYVIVTSKHHDGFCMFDTKETDYKITSDKCPFHTNPKADVVKEVFNAFRAENFWVGAYFSKPDWNNDNYWSPQFPPRDRHVNYDPFAYPDRWEKYTQFTHNQILELMSNYGKVDILWLDGGWVQKMDSTKIREEYRKLLTESKTGFIKQNIVSQDIKMDELVKKCRAKQAGIIVVDRAVYGKNQNYLTPENRVPAEALPYPWESCIISGGGWSYTPDAKYMSGRQGVQLLVDIVAKGGNLLLNIAPGPDGQWQQGAYDLLKEYGDWMKINQKAIYNTHAVAPYKVGNVCTTIGENKERYFYYMAEENEMMPEKITIKISLDSEFKSVKMLGYDKRLKIKRSKSSFTILIPEELRKNPPCKYVWVFEAIAD